MNWRFWRREEDDPEHAETVIRVVSMPTLARWYLYDTMAKDPNKLATAIGLTAVSNEGEETELKASEARAAKVAPYVSFLQSIAAVSAITVTSTYKLGHPEVGEEELDALHDLVAMASYMSSFASFSAAFELGLIENPGMINTEGPLDDE